MPCFLCKKRSKTYQPLDPTRLKFIRIALPTFKDSSYLCLTCFEIFNRIYENKKKQKQQSSISIISDASLRTVSVSSKVSSNANSNREMSSERTALTSGDNTQSNMKDIFELPSPSTQSMDSTDRLVLTRKEFSSLIDSTRKSTRDPAVIVAREDGKQAERSAMKRKRAREDEQIQKSSTIGRRRINTSTIVEEIQEINSNNDNEEDEGEISSSISPNDLANVGPIVKRRREPVVYLQKDVMDIYLANTSGG